MASPSVCSTTGPLGARRDPQDEVGRRVRDSRQLDRVEAGVGAQENLEFVGDGVGVEGVAAAELFVELGAALQGSGTGLVLDLALGETQPHEGRDSRWSR